MTKLREELRSAFEREQATLGEVGDAPQRLLRQGVAAREPAGHRLQWAGAVAAVLIAATVVTTFALVRSRAPEHPVPAASPSATPTLGLTVSDTTPILLIRETSSNQRNIAITWGGKPAGRLPFDSAGYSPNPAANFFASGGAVVDRSNHLLATGTFGFKYFQGTWADDEVHFCLMTPVDNPTNPNGVPTTLKLVEAQGGTSRDVVQVGKLYEQNGISVAACSVEFDRAVVVESAGQGVGTAQYWVVELSTGKILWTHNFQETTGAPIYVVSSRDGQTVAETDGTNTTLYGLDGAVIGHITGAVKTFCWDGSLALVDSGTGDRPGRIVRVSDGSTLWSGPNGPGFYVNSYAAEPDGADIAVGLHDPANTDVNGLPASDLYIVAPDGHVVTVMKDVYW